MRRLALPLAAALAVLPLARPVAAVAPYALKQTRTLGGEGGWDYLQLSPDAHLLYIPRSTVTQILDLSSGKITGTLAGFKTPHGVALVPELHRGFVSDGDRAGAPGVVIFDTTTNQPLGKIKTPVDSDGIIFDPASKHILLVSGDGHSLISFPADIDPQKGTADPAIDLGGAPEYLASNNAGRAYINLQDKDEVAVIDTTRAGGMKVLEKWSTAPGGQPTGMAIDRAAHRLFIGCRKPAKLVVMSTDDGKILASIDIGVGVDAAAFDAPYALASCGDGTLSVLKQIDPDHYADAGKITTAPGARTMTVDPQTHKLYLVTADFEPTAPATPGAKPARPKAIPNTFKLLTLSRQP